MLSKQIFRLKHTVQLENRTNAPSTKWSDQFTRRQGNEG